MNADVEATFGLADTPWRSAVAADGPDFRRFARHIDGILSSLLWLDGALLVAWLGWRYASSSVLPSAADLLIVAAGAAAAAFGTFSVRRWPGTSTSRYVLIAAQSLLMTLLDQQLNGVGRVLAFGCVACVALYCDWRAVVAAASLILAGWAGATLLDQEGAAAERLWRDVGCLLLESTVLATACHRVKDELFAILFRHEKAHQESRAKSEFLANMSHEIRTPMSAVIGYADLLLEPDCGPNERVAHAQTIRRNGEHLLTILDDILDISKIEAGSMTVEQMLCSPTAIVADVASLMRVRAAAKNLFFEVRYLTPIPEWVKSDPTRLRQILMNLVGNAIKFTPTGGVRILASCLEPDSTDPSLSIEVVDTGIGIDAAQAAQLFRPFAQADSSTTRRFGGSGLGLVICQRLAGMLGGKIELESTPGRGSSFRVVVRTGSLHDTRMFRDVSEASAADSGGIELSAEDLPRLLCSVLLAEDGHDNQRLISAHLQAAGALVVVVDNGRKAVETLMNPQREGSFDVVLMDMQMPVLDGYAATTELRQLGYRGVVIALTAHAMTSDRERCLSAGCTDYLTKPISRQRLINTVHRYTGASGPVIRVASSTMTSILPLDRPVISSLVSELSDDDGMLDLIEKFVNNLPSHCAIIESAVASDDRETVRRLSHNLKGSGGSYGFGRITECAALLEDSVRTGQSRETVAAFAKQLFAVCQRARPGRRRELEVTS